MQVFVRSKICPDPCKWGMSLFKRTWVSKFSIETDHYPSRVNKKKHKKRKKLAFFSVIQPNGCRLGGMHPTTAVYYIDTFARYQSFSLIIVILQRKLNMNVEHSS